MSLPADTLMPDTTAAEKFAGKISDVLNSGAAAVMISLGHRLRLFDVMADLPASTSDAIARRAELAERYVREWLAVMVTARIVRYEPASKTYELPSEHAACLTRNAPLGNLAVYAQNIALMGQMQEPLLERFETGEGMSYADYPCFHEIMAEDSQQTVTAALFEAVLPLAEDLMPRLRAGADALDAGCGRGAALIAMAKRFPRSRFIGYDLCVDAIEAASWAARSEGVDNVRFEARDLTNYQEVARFDLITSFDAIHDQKDPEVLIRSLRDALKLGGLYLMQDIGGSAKLENNLDFPMSSFLYAISCCHCTPVSLGQGGRGLGTMWGWETAQEMLHRAGFREVERHVLPHDPMNVWFVARA